MRSSSGVSTSSVHEDGQIIVVTIQLRGSQPSLSQLSARGYVECNRWGKVIVQDDRGASDFNALF